jgi:hypothetical protein
MSFPIRRHPGIAVLLAGLLLGGMADALTRAAPWGVNFTLGTAALLGVLLGLPRVLGIRRSGGTTAALIAAAAGFAFLSRDAAVLATLDALVAVAALAHLAGTREETAGPRSLAGDATRIMGSLLHAGLGPPLLLFHDVQWADVRPGQALRKSAVALRGLVMALPVIAVFTLLLSSADAVFALRVRELFDLDFPLLLSHVVWTAILAWFAAGFVRAAVLRDKPAGLLPLRPTGFGLGRTEVAIVLGLVDLLFGAFVWIQVRYLFGGASFIEGTLGMTYSQYARRGFFELVTVAVLVLALLLLAHWLLDPHEPGAIRLFAVLAQAQVMFVFVMLASAYERMRLYREEFGLTALRFYTTAFMVWLACLLVGFLATVLRGRRDHFARFVSASAVVGIALLHVLDPESLMVRASRSAPHGFDLEYALGLGADAVPALLEAEPTLSLSERRRLAQALLGRWGTSAEPDWRTWNASRARARRLVLQASPALAALTEEGPLQSATKAQP